MHHTAISYLPSLNKVLAHAFADCGMPCTPDYLKEQIIDIIKTQETLTIILQVRQLTLDQQLTIKFRILQELEQEKGFIVVQFRTEIPSSVSSPEPPSSTANPLHVARELRAIPLVEKIIAVASGKGGVGKSTVSASLALSMADQGMKVGLLDADIYGPSIPTLFGLYGPLAADDTGKLQPLNARGVATMSFGYLSDPESPAIWRGPMISKAFRQLCYQVAWGELDYLIIDLPPGTGDIQLTMLESLPIYGAIVVTTPQNLALIDLKKATAMFHKLGIRVLGLIENMSTFQCPHCYGESQPFGNHGGLRYARQQNLDILGTVPFQPQILRDCDAGRLHLSPSQTFASIGAKVLEK